MEKKRITLGGINGNDVDKSVRCQFCGEEMEQGSSTLGFGMNFISYRCECGTMAIFYHHSGGKKISSVRSEFDFKD